MAGHIDRQLVVQSVGGHVAHADRAIGVQGGGDGAHRGFDAVLARGDAAQVGERCDQPDGAVATHAQVAAVVEEDHARCVGGILRRAEQRPHHHVAATRLQHGGCPPGIVALGQQRTPFGHGAGAQVWKAVDDKPGRLAARVGVDHVDALHGAVV